MSNQVEPEMVPVWLQIATPMVKGFESFVACAYPDPISKGDPWTVGYGATGPDICKGVIWTQERADADLNARLVMLGAKIDYLVKVPLNDHQKAALVSLVYNIGVGNFTTSSLLRLLNAGDFEGAANQFPCWCHASGKIVAGLVKRRDAEKQEFLS